MKHFMNSSNLATMKSNNRSLILRLMNTMGKVSRTELARMTGLTKMTVTNITSELITDGIIYETGTCESVSGRKPVMLSLVKDAYYSLGVYISREFITTVLVNLKGEIIREYKLPLDVTSNESGFISDVLKSIEQILHDSSIDMGRLLGIGIASIGPLDLKKGIILDPPNFRGIRSIPVVDAVYGRFGIRVFLDNDMNASALAEKLYGKAKSNGNFVYIGVTNGIGAGIIIDHGLFRGSSGFAGEIGHMTVEADGLECSCGNTGCLELYAGIPAIIRQVRASAELTPHASKWQGEEITWEKVVDHAARGDEMCSKAISRLVYYLSIGIVNTVNAFDPETVLLGHDVALAGDLVVKPLEEMVNRRILFKNSKHVRVELSAFGEHAPCMGAAALVLDRFFNGEI